MQIFIRKWVRKEIAAMMIRVMYYDGLTEMVRPPVLQHLIQTGKIMRFRRTEGWTEIGTDAIRTDRRDPYYGRERRHRAIIH
jgi:hypothetical protein